MRHIPLALLLLTFTGCLVPGSRSEAVTFHAFSAPSAPAARPGPTLCLPRAAIPSGLRRPTVVIEGDGTVAMQDSHRWLAPLESAIPEALGRRITALTGQPCSSQPSSDDHLTLHSDVLRMDVTGGKARLRITLSSLHTQAEVDALVDALSWARDAVEMGYGAGSAVA